MKQVANTGRKLLAILLMTAMVLSLVACGGGNSSTTTDIMPCSSEAESSSQSSYSSEESSSASVSMPTAAPESETVMEKLSEAYALNTDVVGWLYLPNTTVDDPVLLYNETMTVEDNQYYLRKNAVKEYYWYGCYFADFECTFDPLSTNTVIYGHSMDDNPDGLKFSQLKKWLDIDFAQENPYIYLSTPDEDYVFKIFSVMYTNTSFNYIESSPDDTEFMRIVNEARKASQFTYDVDVEAGDKLITLSTCTYTIQAGYPNPYRYVIMGRMVRPGEEVPDTITLTVNPNPTPAAEMS